MIHSSILGDFGTAMREVPFATGVPHLGKSDSACIARALRFVAYSDLPYPLFLFNFLPPAVLSDFSDEFCNMERASGG